MELDHQFPKYNRPFFEIRDNFENLADIREDQGP